MSNQPKLKHCAKCDVYYALNHRCPKPTPTNRTIKKIISDIGARGPLSYSQALKIKNYVEYLEKQVEMRGGNIREYKN